MNRLLPALLAALLLAGCTAAPKTPVPSSAPSSGTAGAEAQTSPAPEPTPSPTPLPANWHRIQPAQDGTVTLAFTGDVNFADDWYIMERYRSSGRSSFAHFFVAPHFSATAEIPIHTAYTQNSVSAAAAEERAPEVSALKKSCGAATASRAADIIKMAVNAAFIK